MALPRAARAAGAALPVSEAQHRLWFLDRTGAGTSYNLPVLLRLRGRLDPAALEAALGDLAARHEVLRTVFAEADGAPVRQVLTGAPPDRRSNGRRCRPGRSTSGSPGPRGTGSTSAPNRPSGPCC
ncbi:hypothetical protein GXW82_04500 [Streptacidiphilus sp. 4-A2]|nr:hypothetical protein [Streptacidiphilus sp. 4-A2]